MGIGRQREYCGNRSKTAVIGGDDGIAMENGNKSTIIPWGEWSQIAWYHSLANDNQSSIACQ